MTAYVNNELRLLGSKICSTKKKMALVPCVDTHVTHMIHMIHMVHMMSHTRDTHMRMSHIHDAHMRMSLTRDTHMKHMKYVIHT